MLNRSRLSSPSAVAGSHHVNFLEVVLDLLDPVRFEPVLAIERLRPASHIGSALLCTATPIAFALIAEATNSNHHRVLVGTVLLSISVLPLLAVHIIDVTTGSPRDPGADVGGALLMLLGLAASVITSLVFTFVLPLAGRANGDRMDNKRASAS
jgi:hypothetical protein